MTIRTMIGPDFALIPDPVETKSPGGIDLPEAAQKKKQSGTIAYVGTGSLDQYGNYTPLKIKVGDRVLYSKYALATIELDGVEYLTGKEDAVICVLDKEESDLSPNIDPELLAAFNG